MPQSTIISLGQFSMILLRADGSTLNGVVSSSWPGLDFQGVGSFTKHCSGTMGVVLKWCFDVLQLESAALTMGVCY